MQFLVSRLASPTLVDFDEDGRKDALSVDDQIMSLQPLCTSVLPSVGLQQQRGCAEKVYHSDVPDCTVTDGQQQQQQCAEPQATCAARICHTSMPSVIQSQGDQKSVVTATPSVVQQQDVVGQQADPAQNSSRGNMPQFATAHVLGDQISVGQKSHCVGKSCCAAVSSDTESTMSLNELLDGCHCAVDVGEVCATGSCDTGKCSPQTVSHLSEIVSILHVSVGPDTTRCDSILQILENSPTRLGLNSSRPSKFGGELTGHDESASASCVDVMGMQMHTDCQTGLSPEMQRSFAESNLSSLSLSSDKAHVDEGYHSNATSALSQDATTCDDAILSVSA